jgi:monofunctional biosynthetic peptidoglycan transglycosylase
MDPAAKLDYQWVPYHHISPYLKRAVIAAEDAKFIEHEGFDWQGIQQAWRKNLKQNKIVAGGSTISQQLAKNLFLSSARHPLRKAEEALITFMLESILEKKRILEIYLNVIQWGNTTFGAEMAARRYYHTSAKNLSAGQAARLAAMLPHPEYYETHPKSRRLHHLTHVINRRLHSAEIP